MKKGGGNPPPRLLAELTECLKQAGPSRGALSKALDYSRFGLEAASSSVLFQETLGVQRGHAACASAGDGLAVHMVLHVAGGKHTGDAGLRGKTFQAALGHDIAVSSSS